MTSPFHSVSQTPSRGSLAELLRRREAGAWPYAFRVPRDHGDPSTGLAGAAEVALEMCGGPTDAKFLSWGEGGLPGGGETSYCAGTRPVHTQMHCARGGTGAVAQSAAPARGRSSWGRRGKRTRNLFCSRF